MNPRRIAVLVCIGLALPAVACGSRSGLNAFVVVADDAGERQPALRDAAPDVRTDAALEPRCSGLVSSACLGHPEGPSYGFVGLDLDFDEDCIADAVDDCPAKRNPDQADGDGDGLGDACDQCADSDLDLDGICDGVDVCRRDWNPSQIDIDGDGSGDACDTQSCFSPLGPQEKQRYLAMLVRHSEFADLVTGIRWRMASAVANCTSARTIFVRFTIYDYDARRIITAVLNVADDTVTTRIMSAFDGGAQVSSAEAFEATELARADPVVGERLSTVVNKIETTVGYFRHSNEPSFASCAEGRCVEVEFAQINKTAILRLFNAVVDLKACRVLGVV